MADIEVEYEGEVTWVKLNRPAALNALTPDMHRELNRVFDAFPNDAGQRICVVTGEGDKAFCAGSDLKSFDDSGYPEGGYAGIARRFDLNKPVIAMVNGFALGGGFELALACDLVIAADTASFGLPEPRVGAIALGGGLHRLPRQIGLKPAMDLILTARQVSAAEGYQMGFVNAVCSAEDLRGRVERYCRMILKGSPIAVETSKALVKHSLSEAELETALANQTEYPEFKKWQQAEDTMEGINAFVEKRKPEWKNR